MGLFFNRNQRAASGKRLTGFPRYTEVLERNIKGFLLTNVLTFVGFLPFFVGVVLAILSSSILVMIPACIIGGLFAGPALSCMYDFVFRALRDATGNFMDDYKRALKQNWRQSIVPGIAFCLLMGLYIFMAMLFWWSVTFPGWGTIAIYLVSLFLFIMFATLTWAQLVLFDQPLLQIIKNCLFFILRYFPKVAASALLQLLFIALLVLFLPWSGFIIPIFGFWFIIYTSVFIIYNTLNDSFKIEERIAQVFPEQEAFYEDDEAWLARKKEENNASDHTSG